MELEVRAKSLTVFAHLDTRVSNYEFCVFYITKYYVMYSNIIYTRTSQVLLHTFIVNTCCHARFLACVYDTYQKPSAVRFLKGNMTTSIPARISYVEIESDIDLLINKT